MSEGVTVVTGAVEGFDYGALDSETRIVVQQRTGEIRSLVQRSAQDIYDIGLKLGEVKQRLGHGGFGRWLDAEFQWNERTAQRFMQVAVRFQNRQIVGFAPSALYLLAAPSTPEEAVDEALERAAGGERITHAAAKGIVDGYRPPVGRVDGMDGVDGRRAGRGETEEELRQRIRETDRRWKDEINGRYAAQAAGPVLPPVELMPIEGWELEEFVERVAGEVFGESAPRSERAWNAMTVSARSMTGEFWAKLRRTLAPFDVVDGRLQVAVYELVKGWKEASGENGQRSTGNGELSTAPSAEARRFGQEVKAATWGGVQRDDRPMVTAEGLANSLRGWAADAVPVSLRDGYDSDEWYTPRWMIEAARSVMGEIDLDPASCALAQDVVQAGLFWSKTQGGERMGWFGRVWLNPPYSAPALFVEKLLAEYTSGNVKQAVVLLNNATETGWFQALLARFPVCFLSKRLAFWRHDHADVGARQGQAVFYLGPDVEKFCEVFGEFGIVVRRVD